MGIKEIEERIISESNTKSNEIKLAGEKDLLNLKNQLEEDKKAKALAISKEYVQKAKNTKISLVTPHLLSYKQEILLKKKSIFENIFSECLNESETDKNYKAIIKRLIQSLEGEKSCFEIISPDSKKEITAEALSELQKEDHKMFSKFSISKETRPIKSGFIVKGEKIELNFSFDTLWQKIKEKYSEEIAKILFEGK